METLFTQLATLQELFLLKGVMLDNEFDIHDDYEITSVSQEMINRTKQNIYALHDSREHLLERITKLKKQIILEATRAHEICLKDFATDSRIEVFSAQLNIKK